MRAKVVVFPIRGRNWCFSRSIDPSIRGDQSPNTPSTFKELYNRIFSQHGKKSDGDSKVEVAVDFVSNKMNRAWSNLENAPQGTIKNKIHGLGLKLLSRVKPSEIFFKSIPKDINRVDIVYPSSLNPRLVRRRLRHIAFRGSVIHKKYLYGSAILLPLTSFFMVLPLPNIPFFWILFRTYSHWRATQGSEKLLQLVSEASSNPNESSVEKAESGVKGTDNSPSPLWVFEPSEELQKLLHNKEAVDGLSESAISNICNKFYLNSGDVAKYRHSI
ncbi:hypothetical protein ABFS82_09G129600 [Erythranthe guttata]|uniref:Uncharacterized protein n=1 Tax=Erythranthe guttata TaxID=4155 RepID=A0A022PY40_ERYGU|nr:PREDICTED: uncharacterized protein C23H3.12c [Erythranthe guttata]EYU21257.1 hypothetical protein MIMGU_mgv1a011733mg [Erythranthe guttata]EYU21258.1 hypothetical protein MIMGU_mgv1a011733mg [Erythranthe guttata]|eukprot:XP_012856845.1 PREDICTED: uncharacterized protein C23H3.12c [Erythranthe guttata]